MDCMNSISNFAEFCDVVSLALLTLEILDPVTYLCTNNMEELK